MPPGGVRGDWDEEQGAEGVWGEREQPELAGRWIDRGWSNESCSMKAKKKKKP